MPRTSQVTVPGTQTDTLLARVRGPGGVVGLSLQRGASLDPPGDALTLQTTSDSLHAAVRVLSLEVIDGSSVTTREPHSPNSRACACGVGRRAGRTGARPETVFQELSSGSRVAGAHEQGAQ